MELIAKEKAVEGVAQAESSQQAGECTRFSQGRFLDELAGSSIRGNHVDLDHRVICPSDLVTRWGRPVPGGSPSKPSSAAVAVGGGAADTVPPKREMNKIVAN